MFLGLNHPKALLIAATRGRFHLLQRFLSSITPKALLIAATSTVTNDANEQSCLNHPKAESEHDNRWLSFHDK